MAKQVKVPRKYKKKLKCNALRNGCTIIKITEFCKGVGSKGKKLFYCETDLTFRVKRKHGKA